MKKTIFYLFILLVLAGCTTLNVGGYDKNDPKIKQGDINWLLDRSQIQEPRGGTTRGIQTHLDPKSSEYYLKLSQDHNLTKKERDRLSILALSGEYKVSFEFTELYGSKPEYELDSPYKSWGTEVVFVINNDEDFISLQHIMVMYYKDSKGKMLGPFVQKHWRQDWLYQDTKILDYKSNRKWINNFNRNSKDQWSQTVYQVDDTPRYESSGIWVHKNGASKWVSNTTRRPLPRREFSIRSDYDLLEGVNKITVVPWGWMMEEINDKVKNPNVFIGSEFGVARYQRIKGFDFEPAYQYWNETKNFWEIVRSKWRFFLENNKKICINKLVDNKPSYIHYFELAEEFKKNKNFQTSKKKIHGITTRIIKDCD